MTRPEVASRIEIMDLFVGKEQELRERFLNGATVTNPEKKYISAPMINQRLDTGAYDLAADLIIEQFARRGNKFDIVTGIQYSGVPLGFLVAVKLGLPYAPSRKQEEVPATWKNPFIIKDEIESFTTGKSSSHAFNGIRSGDKLLVVDDVIAHGTTSVPILTAMREAGMEVEKAAFFAKLFDSGVERLQDMGVDPVFAIGIDNIVQNSSGEWSLKLAPPQFS